MEWKLRLRELWCVLFGHPVEPQGDPYPVGGLGMVQPNRCWCGAHFRLTDDQGRVVTAMKRP